MNANVIIMNLHAPK